MKKRHISLDKEILTSSFHPAPAGAGAFLWPFARVFIASIEGPLSRELPASDVGECPGGGGQTPGTCYDVSCVTCNPYGSCPGCTTPPDCI